YRAGRATIRAVDRRERTARPHGESGARGPGAEVMKITRRRLAAAIIAPAALLAQTPPPPIPANAEEELAAIREQNRRNSQALDEISVPMAVEPAFQFKA